MIGISRVLVQTRIQHGKGAVGLLESKTKSDGGMKIMQSRLRYPNAEAIGRIRSGRFEDEG
jgi:hypothetical protein